MVFALVTPQTVAAAEGVDTPTVVRHDTTETGEVGTAYFRYH
jgi:hypothetical protein